jgi:hypothetical protein
MSHPRTFIYESSDIPPSMTLRDYRREHAPAQQERRPPRRAGRLVRALRGRQPSPGQGGSGASDITSTR